LYHAFFTQLFFFITGASPSVGKEEVSRFSFSCEELGYSDRKEFFYSFFRMLSDA
jgi:hypothetical protein